MPPPRTLQIRRAPDGTAHVFARTRGTPRRHLHSAHDTLSALTWTAAALGLRLSIVVPRRGRTLPRRRFALARLREAVAYALRGSRAKRIHLRIHPLPGSRIPPADAWLRILPGTCADALHAICDDLGRTLAANSRHATPTCQPTDAA